MSLQFPPDFVFGVATSAYQVEGGIENDWSAWERAGKLKDPQHRNTRAADHWARFYDDIALIQATGASAYRLSLEWARLEPTQGHFDDTAWNGYRSRLEALVKAGIRPVVTLHHFTHPTWFHAQTPWHSPASLTAWRRYVVRCAELLEGLNAAVITINEPMVFLLGGYLSGLMPPGHTNGAEAWAALCNVVRAHAIANDVLRARTKVALTDIGISQNVMAFAAARRLNPIDYALARLAGSVYNHAFLEALSTGVLAFQLPGVMGGREKIEGAEKSTSFVGINYYTRAHLRFITKLPFVSWEFQDPMRRGTTDLGWELYPEGFGQLLRQMSRYHLPVWVTENGLDDRNGLKRTQFIHAHLKELLLAREAGVPVTAYFHWALMDNFEWLEGWGPRFGLFRVDEKTMERTATPAVAYFRGIASTRRLETP